MFEHLDRISANAPALMEELTPLQQKDIDLLLQKCPECPSEYLSFVRERGVGGLEGGEMFFFERTLIDAETELFYDKEIYRLGARGPVKIFGSEFSGVNYGFDTGDMWALVQVNPDRSVKRLNLSFMKFIEGMFVCYPDYPISYDCGRWHVATGEEYALPVS